MLRRFSFVLLLLTPASASLAQKGPELTPLFGARIGGSLRLGIEEGFPLAEQRIVEAQSSASFGAIFDYGLTEHFQIELLWTHQGTELKLGPDVGGGADGEPVQEEGAPLFDVGIDTFHGGFLYGGGVGRFRPFVSAGIGVSRLDADLGDATPKTHFSFSVASGFKSYLTERIGLRFDARAFGTRPGGDIQTLACGEFGCASFELGATFWQGHLAGGVIVSF